MNRSKIKGTSWETAIVRYLAETGWPHAERRTLSGIHDRGDVAGVIGVVIEAKNCKTVSLGAWLDEAEAERTNARAHVGVVWHHGRGKASPADGFVTMSGAQFVALLIEAGYGDDRRMQGEALS